MPPKRGRGRGGSRGGSRGGRGRGGGNSGSFAPFKLSKSLKRRSRRKGNTELPMDQDTPELMDLGQTSYSREVRFEKPLMKSLSQRPNRSMMKEARYTDKHMEKTMSLTLRHRPVEFVKAEFNYDPSKDLIKRLRIGKEGEKEENELKDENIEITKDLKKENEAKLLNNGVLDVKINEGELGDEIERTERMKEPSLEELLNEGSKDLKEATPVAEEILDEVQKLIIESAPSECIEVKTVETVGKLDNIDGEIIEEIEDQLEVETETPVEAEVEMEVEELKMDVVSPGKEEESDQDSDSNSIEFEIDLIGDTAALNKYKVSKPNTASLLQNEYKTRKVDESRPKEVANVEVETYLTVGKVILKTSLDDDGSLSVKLPKGKINKSAKNGFVSFKEGKNNQRDPFQVSQLSGKSHHEKHFQSDSEFDDAFDDYMSQLMAANEDSDSDSDSVSEFNSGRAAIVEDSDVDIDGEGSDYGVHDDDDDQVYEKLRAEYQKDLGDIVSDSESSSIDFDRYMEELEMGGDLGDADDFDDLDDIGLDLNSDEEGLEEILSFAKQHRRLANLDLDLNNNRNVPPPRVGKGKKQRLELGSDLEMELRESLMEQFHYQKQSRRLKKIKKKEKKLQDAMDNLFLKDKYEYSLHIKEIKQEFELFLHDVARETLSFPPLDGHGNKTLSKLATNYNMKCIKCGGNGTALYMKIAKTKKTFRYVPDYQLIGYILKQRPVFRRADVKPRTRDEIVETGDDKMRRGPKSNAYVREGDVVGALAPEIDQNNIGRKMLEMLGWLRGEGLGALGNKGISTPVLATVKKTKAGLK